MSSVLSAWRSLGSSRPRAELYRAWRLGIAAGFTAHAALEMGGASEDPDTERARRWLVEGARRGRGIGDLVSTGGSRFDAIERGLLALGDESGQMEDSLRLLAHWFERRHRLMLVVRKRLAYPLILAIVATVLLPLPLLFAGHARVYALAVGGGASAWLLAGGTIVSAAAAAHARSPAMVRARLARALATAVEAGLPLGRAVRLAADAAGDPAVQRFVAAIDERTLATQPVARSLAGCPRITPELLALLDTAERTGDFTTTLVRLAELYEDGFR